MCRLVAYTGSDILLADVLIKPENSIVKQSLFAKETSVPTNGDGFGLGWYTPDISPNPAVFLSVFPAWNDQNLLHLASKIKSSLFFAHVRAASSGGVSNYNCHPFIHKKWMFMHNGEIHNFITIKRHLRRLLDDDIYHWIRGETDSEHFFALFLQLAKDQDLTQLSVVASVLRQTFITIDQLLVEYANPGVSWYNLCLTDGKRMIASRYSTNNSRKPASLHYLEGSYFQSRKNALHKKSGTNSKYVLIASEKLTDFSSEWREVPINHLLLVEKDYTTRLEAV